MNETEKIQMKIKQNEAEMNRLQKEIDEMSWVQKWAGLILGAVILLGLLLSLLSGD